MAEQSHRALARTEASPSRGKYAREAAIEPSNHVPLPQVTAVAKAAGKTIFGKDGFLEAFGGDRCLKPPKQWYWQVTYVRGKRYLPEESLNHVSELSDAHPEV